MNDGLKGNTNGELQKKVNKNHHTIANKTLTRKSIIIFCVCSSNPFRRQSYFSASPFFLFTIVRSLMRTIVVVVAAASGTDGNGSGGSDGGVYFFLVAIATLFHCSGCWHFYSMRYTFFFSCVLDGSLCTIIFATIRFLILSLSPSCSLSALCHFVRLSVSLSHVHVKTHTFILEYYFFIR